MCSSPASMSPFCISQTPRNLQPSRSPVSGTLIFPLHSKLWVIRLCVHRNDDCRTFVVPKCGLTQAEAGDSATTEQPGNVIVRNRLQLSCKHDDEAIPGLHPTHPDNRRASTCARCRMGIASPSRSSPSLQFAMTGCP
jgi:hypothetical protein